MIGLINNIVFFRVREMVCADVLPRPALFHPAIDKKLSIRMQPLFTVSILRCPRLLLLDSRQIGLVEASAAGKTRRSRLTGVDRKAIRTITLPHKKMLPRFVVYGEDFFHFLIHDFS
jgi:hypothetical protein